MTPPPRDRADRARLVNRTTDRVLAPEVRIAHAPLAQLVGWMGPSRARSASGGGGALGLPRCPIVHTFFVPMPLDVAFCDAAGRVLRVVADLKPFRVSPWTAGAAFAWEMPAGTLAPFTSPGDVLVVEQEKAPG